MKRIITQKNKTATGRYIIAALVAVIISFCAPPLQAQTFTTELSENRVLVGDHIKWEWILSLKPSDRLITPPDLPVDSVGKILVLNRSSIDTTITDTGSLYTQSLTLAGYDSFLIQLPSLSVHIYSSDVQDTLTLISVDTHHILVSTVDVDTAQDFKPIKDIVHIENPELLGRLKEHLAAHKTTYIILAIILLLLLILWILRKAWKRRNPNRVVEQPYQKAFRKMNELEKAQLWEKGEYKKYYTELALIIKEYIQEEKGMDTNRLTSTELLREFKKNRKLRTLHKPLRDLLYTADLTKFAKGTPQEEDRQEALQHAELIINTMEQDKIRETIHAQ